MGLKVNNQISVWLETQTGYDEYNRSHPGKPGYFLHFTTPFDAVAFASLSNALTWCKEKILGTATGVKPSYAFIQKGDWGKAGACYTYPDPNIQDERNIASLEDNLIANVTQWAAANGASITSTKYDPDDEKYLIVTIQVQTTSI